MEGRISRSVHSASDRLNTTDPVMRMATLPHNRPAEIGCEFYHIPRVIGTPHLSFCRQATASRLMSDHGYNPTLTFAARFIMSAPTSRFARRP